jgi:hypothetical protein
MIQRNPLPLFLDTRVQRWRCARRKGQARHWARSGTFVLWYISGDHECEGHPPTPKGTTFMNKGREIRSYDYVNHPYERVRDALRENAPVVFQAATKAAAARAQSVAAELHVDFGGIGLSTDIKIFVKGVEEKIGDSGSSSVMRLLLEWEAATMPRLFPFMKADLSIYPLTSTETQLDFFGVYEPPFGTVGKTMNAIAGHRIAEASVHRFVSDVAEYLRRTLASI